MTQPALVTGWRATLSGALESKHFKSQEVDYFLDLLTPCLEDFARVKKNPPQRRVLKS